MQQPPQRDWLGALGPQALCIALMQLGALGPLGLPVVCGQFCWNKCKIGPNQQVVVATESPLAIVATPLSPATPEAGRPTALDCGQLCAAPKRPALPPLGLGPCKGMVGQLDLGGMQT